MLRAVFLLFLMCRSSICAVLTSSTISYKLEDSVYIRVYITNGHNIIEKYFDSHKWNYGSFNQTGSTVGATYYIQDTNPIIRVYVGRKGMIQEYRCDDQQTWQLGTLSVEGEQASAMSFERNGVNSLRVYVTHKNNSMSEWGEDGQGWVKQGFYL